MIYRKIQIALAALLLGAGSLWAGEPVIAIKAVSESRFVYEPFYLQIDVTSDQEPQRPVLKDGNGYTVASLSHGYRSSASKQSVTSFRVEVVASKKGILTIAPAVIRIGERVLRTAPLRLLVDEPRRADGSVVEVAFSVTNLYVDQAVEMTVKWHSQTPFIQYQELMLDIPALRHEGFTAYSVDPMVPEEQRIGVPVNAQRIIARKLKDDQGESLVFRYMLVPQTAGLYDFGELRLAAALMKNKESSNQYPSYFNNNFFIHPETGSRFERVYQTATIPPLSVSALPEKGRTPLYCGVAGELSAKAMINPREAVVGQPMMYEVVLTNMAFGLQVAALPDAVLENIGPFFKLTREPIQSSATAKSRKFVYALRPLQSNIGPVPGLAIQIFDVKSREYRMVRTAPLTIKILPDGDAEVYTPARGNADNPQVMLTGIRANKKQSVVLMNGYEILEFMGQRAWLFWLLPIIVWVLIRGWVKHIERCRLDAAYARSSQALSRFKRLIVEDEEFALREYIADRFGLCAAALTRESCASELAAHGLPSEVIQLARDYFESRDKQKYAPSQNASGSQIAVKKLVKAIQRGTKILVTALILTPFLNLAEGALAQEILTDSMRCKGGYQSRIESEAAQKFTAAMELRANRPDEARPIFVDAALEFEAEGRYFNAGNSWFFAGESGRALASYLAAESLAPFNREIRAGIAFIRTQREPDFPAQAGVSSKVISVWRQICRWDIHLRLGFVSLLYLIAWVIYTFSRIFGWTPGRRFWLTYGAAMGVIAVTILYSLTQPERGVVIQSVEARLGPGYAYAPAYESVLHSAVEFDWQTKEGAWVSARLPDGNTVWLHESSCVKVRISL